MLDTERIREQTWGSIPTYFPEMKKLLILYKVLTQFLNSIYLEFKNMSFTVKKVILYKIFNLENVQWLCIKQFGVTDESICAKYVYVQYLNREIKNA